MRHDPTRFQRLPHVSQSCHRVGEKHRSKARKDEIILGLEVVKQRIAIDERNILQAQLSGVLSAVLEERLAAILSDNLTALAHSPRQLYSRIAKATANIKNVVALFDRQRRKNSFTVVGQPIDQDVLIFYEFRNQDFVPEIHVLGALHVRFDCAHSLSSQNAILNYSDLLSRCQQRDIPSTGSPSA